jgi:hypothetical protein
MAGIHIKSLLTSPIATRTYQALCPVANKFNHGPREDLPAPDFKKLLEFKYLVLICLPLNEVLFKGIRNQLMKYFDERCGGP